jgi:hypothetical protein
MLETGRARTTKVSHSLNRSVAARLKQLAYSERVSESSIIEFLLTEFFVLGDDETLGRIIRDSALTLRRNQPPHLNEQVPMHQLLDDLTRARHKLVRSFEAWHDEPKLDQLNAVGLARAEVASILNQISRVGGNGELGNSQ